MLRGARLVARVAYARGGSLSALPCTRVLSTVTPTGGPDRGKASASGDSKLSTPISPLPNVGSEQDVATTTQGKPPKKGFMQLVRSYGTVGVVTYFGVYFATLGSMFVAVDTGLVVPVDVVSTIKWLHLDQFIDLSTFNPKAGSFAIAWILTKFTEPARLGLTILITPSIARLVKKTTA